MHAKTDNYKDLKLKLEGIVPPGLVSIAIFFSIASMRRCRATRR
ncbi:MAG TPA: hypothetical protein VFL68_03655 [Pseudolabrys sp.]|nr:hypothetical protein [Pseudolabrys sp.]